MMPGRMIHVVQFICIILVCFLVGCGGSGHGPLPAVVDPVSYGPARALRVNVAAGGIITDAASDLTFVFPAGGNGMLTLAPITAAPARSLSGGAGYQVRFSQDAPVSIRYPMPASGERLLYCLRDAGGCYDDIARPAVEWLTVPPRNPGDGFLYFDLAQSTVGRGRQSFNEVIDTFWSLTVDPPANAQILRQYVTNAQRDCVTALPEPLQAGVLQRQAERGGTVYFRDPGLGSFYYYTRVFGASIYLRTDIDQTTAVHETAHYMTHMLMTDEQWAVLQNNAPQIHAIGDVFTRTSALTEDYAYYLQSLMGYPSVSVTNAATLCGSSLLPSKVDLPSVEGYAATLLGYLTIANSPHVDFRRVQSALPSVGLAPGQAIMPFRNGPLSITTLYPEIEKYLGAHGYPPAALSVIAERSGWSYNGKGMIFDGDQPATGATIQAVIQYEKDGLTYRYTTPSAIVDANGEYTLERLFPGSMLLQVTYQGHTTDIEYAINRDERTNITREIPTITLGDLGSPAITRLEPDTGMPGDTITLVGRNFGAVRGSESRVLFNNVLDTAGYVPVEVVSWSATAIRVTVPQGLDAPAGVLVQTGAESYSTDNIYFFAGNGQRYLAAMTGFDRISIGAIENLMPEIDDFSITVDHQANVARDWQTQTHAISWNGRDFLATMTGSSTYPSGESLRQQVTISGNIDPIRYRIVTAHGTLQMDIGDAAGGHRLYEVDIQIEDIEGGSPLISPTQTQVLFGNRAGSIAGLSGQRPASTCITAYRQRRIEPDGTVSRDHTLVDLTFPRDIFIEFRKAAALGSTATPRRVGMDARMTRMLNPKER